MGNFQDSRFFGISSRTVWLTGAVVALVVGLFFIPEMIKFKLSPGKQLGDKQPRGVAQRAEGTSERASLAPKALKDLSSNLRQKNPPQEVKTAKKPVVADQSPQEEGFFSGLNLQVKAGVGGSVRPIAIPSGLSIDKLNTKVAQNFFRSGRGALSKLIDRNQAVPYGAHDSLSRLLAGFDAVANGLPKDAQILEAGQQLQNLHTSALHALAATGADRGLLLEYLQIPQVRFLDESMGRSSAAVLISRFAPRLVLRSLTLKQVWRQAGLPPGVQLTGELGVRGSDVQKVALYAGSVKVGEYRLGAKDGEGFSSVRLNGDGLQMWTVVAYDKYGARPYAKSYSFMPRARRFGTKADGTYNIAFRPGSARYSLDRFFYAGGNRSGSSSGDPAVSVF